MDRVLEAWIGLVYMADLKEDGQMVTADKKVGIGSVLKRLHRLVDMARRITRKNRHAAIETGQPRGKEAW